MCRTRWWFSFDFLDWKYPFWVNLVQKFKIVRLSWILVPRPFRICSDVLLQVLFKKSVWHFDVTWLISQEFIRRDLKPVAFFVFIWTIDKLSGELQLIITDYFTITNNDIELTVETKKQAIFAGALTQQEGVFLSVFNFCIWICHQSWQKGLNFKEDPQQ